MRLLPRFRRKRRLKPELEALASVVQSSGYFDPAWYLRNYPETSRFRAGPIAHFCEYGLIEQRDPGPSFSTRSYLRRRPTVGDGREPAFLEAMRLRTEGNHHLWAPSEGEGLKAALIESGLFQEDWYLRRYPDVVPGFGSNPIRHYLEHGMHHDSMPGPAFDPVAYRLRYPDFDVLFATPIEHYLFYGKSRGLVGSGNLYDLWIEAYDELTDADQALIAAESERSPLPGCHVVQVIERSSLAHVGTIVDGLLGQIGVATRISLLVDPTVAEAVRDVLASSGDPVRHAIEILDGSSDENPIDRLKRGAPRGEAVLFVYGAVLLRPHAAALFARALNGQAFALAYSDNDALDGGTRVDPEFKPDFSPLYLAQRSYIGPVLAVSAAALEAATYDGAVVEFLRAGTLHRLSAVADRSAVTRIPFVLYHRLGSGPRQNDAVVQAPGRDLAPGAAEGSDPSVSVIIPTRDHRDILRSCIDSILQTTDYPADRLHILVVDNDTQEPAAQSYLRSISQRPGITVVASPGAFNFAAICNRGAAAARSDILIFLNNDTTVISPDWVRRLVSQARLGSVGVVGAQLLYPDDTIQHGGVVLGVSGVAAHRQVGLDRRAVPGGEATREMTAVTGACIAIRKRVFDELGGFDTILAVAFNDVKLCVCAFAAGYRNIYVAKPLLYHHESKSRGFDDSPAKLARNIREAAYVVGSADAIFRNDPSYNPNLSLATIDALAFPPRILRPWRVSASGRRVLLLSSTHQEGYGVPVVVAQHAAGLVRHGFEVTIGGPIAGRDIAYPSCRRVHVATDQDAAQLAIRGAFDVVVAHTPPFFNVSRLLGSRPFVYHVDYGEPNPEFFPDRAAREAIDRDKRLAAAYAKRVFTISTSIRNQQFRKDAVVARIGNSHLVAWTPEWAAVRPYLRDKLAMSDRFVILNVCRFHRGERDYKGVDRYAVMREELHVLHPEIAERCVFVIAGRGDPDDVAHLERTGLDVRANVSDAELRELYAAADLYMNLSRWEGYNLGVGQALAMGLPTIASDIEAHREFPIAVSNSPLETCAFIAEAFGRWSANAAQRVPFLEHWDQGVDIVCETLISDLDEARSRPASP